MIVFAAKVSVRKIVVGVLAVGLVLVGAAALLPKTAEADTAVSAEGAALSAKLKTNEDRVALLTACGWSVENEPVGTQEVQIPDTSTRYMSSTTLFSRRRDWILRRIRQTRHAVYLRADRLSYRRAGRDRQPFGAQQPPDRSGYHIRADGWICAWPAGYAADLTVVDNDFRKLHNCAIQRKSYHRFMVSIGNFRGIALFLHLAIVQFAKKCYPYKRNVLAEGTKCHRCDWTNCCPT
ncbi:DUF4830 domain-containing protein [Butyricicoccus sp. OF10-2]|uniref:DUF4830 domain-containing protein n=1 Tax=Butyricicoccus sp. OF10-2 TaxID=2292298 RepID=UPI001FAA2C6D|nr:DUF4830 domain-containing protein [Butyricicoccus sp. OF10-2]